MHRLVPVCLQVVNSQKHSSVFFVYLSRSSAYTPGAIYNPGDSGQSLLTAPESLLSPQVGRNGRADHVGRAADEEAGSGQQH